MVLNLVAQYFRDATVTTVNSVPNLAWPNSDEQYRATVTRFGCYSSRPYSATVPPAHTGFLIGPTLAH